jgi:hypothetical protein
VNPTADATEAEENEPPEPTEAKEYSSAESQAAASKARFLVGDTRKNQESMDGPAMGLDPSRVFDRKKRVLTTKEKN